MSNRLDLYIKDELNISRQKASELIKLGNIEVNGNIITKTSFQVKENDDIKILRTDNALKYVSRGGYKLEKALNSFDINLNGKICIDIGASTGGFTDCMLQNGASKVYACDVGSNQLVDKLKNDDRVISIENTDIRDIKLNEQADFISCDVSFISLKYIFDKAKTLLKSNGNAVFLVKPQFECGKEYLNKKGIVKNPKVHKRVLKDILIYLNNIDFFVSNIEYSPIRGGDGNIEYIIIVSYQNNNYNFDIDNLVDEAFNNLK